MERYDIPNVKQFLLGGKSYFTVENDETKNHLTYKIVKAENSETTFFVNVCHAYNEYNFIGTIFLSKDGTDITFRKSKKLKQDEQQTSVAVIIYIINHYLIADRPNLSMKFYHHGVCCKCGRTLTTPESVKNGIGPYCASL